MFSVCLFFCFVFYVHSCVACVHSCMCLAFFSICFFYVFFFIETEKLLKDLRMANLIFPITFRIFCLFIRKISKQFQKFIGTCPRFHFFSTTICPSNLWWLFLIFHLTACIPLFDFNYLFINSVGSW